MPRFYMHVCDGSDFVEDDEGVEAADLGAARKAAVEGLRDILAGELKSGVLRRASFIEIENEDRELLATVTFADAVEEQAGPEAPEPA